MFAVVEERGVEGQGLFRGAADLEEGDGFLCGPTGVEEIDGEGPLFPPKAGFHFEADVAVLVVAEVFPEVVEFAGFRSVGFGGELAGPLAELVEGGIGRAEREVAEQAEGERGGEWAAGDHGCVRIFAVAVGGCKVAGCPAGRIGGWEVELCLVFGLGRRWVGGSFAGMKSILLAPFLALPFSLVAAPFEVSLLQCQIGRSAGEELPFDVKPMGYEAGVKLSFLVKGENLVSFKDDSVEIKSFTLGDGRQWARTRSGKANWKQESFSKVGEEGNLGTFTVGFPGDLFGSVEGSSIEGSVVAVTASESEEKTVEIAVGDKKKIAAGSYKVSGGSGGAGFFGGGGDGTSVSVHGDIKGIVEVVVKDGEKKLDGRGSSWSGETKTFQFEKAKGKKLSVTVRYWTDLEEVEVPFKVAPAKK